MDYDGELWFAVEQEEYDLVKRKYASGNYFVTPRKTIDLESRVFSASRQDERQFKVAGYGEYMISLQRLVPLKQRNSEINVDHCLEEYRPYVVTPNSNYAFYYSDNHEEIPYHSYSKCVINKDPWKTAPYDSFLGKAIFNPMISANGQVRAFITRSHDIGLKKQNRYDDRIFLWHGTNQFTQVFHSIPDTKHLHPSSKINGKRRISLFKS